MPKNKTSFWLISALIFLWGYAYIVPQYIQTSFLEQFVDVKYVSYYVFGASLIMLVTVLLYPKLIKRKTNYYVTLGVMLLNIVNIFFLISVSHPALIFIGYVIQTVSMYLLYISLDIFLENISDDATTGKTRTLYLFFMHLSVLAGALSMGFIVGESNRYWLAYLIAAFTMIPGILILLSGKKYLSDHERYSSRKAKEVLHIFKKNRDLRNIFSISFILRFFYAIMALFAPLFLHNTIGLSWAEIGVMLTIALIPFNVLQMPAGSIADRYIGEKEILVFGLIVMMVAVGLMFYVDSPDFLVWASILVLTRVGAALVEAMQEVYFFKHVEKRDIDIINVFRLARPVSWMLASIGAAIILTFFDVRYVFLFLAIIIFVGVRPALGLRDTK